MSCLEPGNRFLCPSQDLAAIPDFESGAMENWGLTTYRESILLFDAEKSSASDKLGITMTVSHELAHQVHKVNHAFKNCGEATSVLVLWDRRDYSYSDMNWIDSFPMEKRQSKNEISFKALGATC